jgi:hypothetical protein
VFDDGDDLIHNDEPNPSVAGGLGETPLCDIFRSVDERDPPGRFPTAFDEERRVAENWIGFNRRLTNAALCG